MTVIPVFKPNYGDEEMAHVRESIHSGWVGLGPKVAEFERRFAAYIGVPHMVGLVSGTAALDLAMLLADVKGREVITTPLTFVSTNHAILYHGGTPVFCDLDPDTLNIDASRVEALITPKTRAIMTVHYGGHACDMDPILELAARHRLVVVEDCAHATGGSYKGRRLGSLGDYGCFSFHAVKNLAMGEGGAISTRSEVEDARLRRLRWLGISKSTWERSDNAAHQYHVVLRCPGARVQMPPERHRRGYRPGPARQARIGQLAKARDHRALQRSICGSRLAPDTGGEVIFRAVTPPVRRIDAVPRCPAHAPARSRRIDERALHPVDSLRHVRSIPPPAAGL